MIAVCPQNAAALEELRAERKITFAIVVDQGNEVAAQFGVRHGFSDALKEVYQGFGLDLAVANNDDSWTLPMPMRLVIDREGVIRASAADPDYKVRPEPEEVLPVLDSLATS